MLRERFAGWQAAVLTGNPPLARNLGIYAKRTHRVFNGTIECRLLRFELDAAERAAGPPKRCARTGRAARARRCSPTGCARICKRLERWAEREHIECFRVYDADMPEYAFAIDLYGREGAPRLRAGVRRAEDREPGERARAPPRGARGAAGGARPCRRQHVHSRRAPAAEGQRAVREARASAASATWCSEGGLKFWVNFRDYLDTGLFLDHRIVRRMLRDWAKGADFLNLFCYTGSATVYAAAGGARSTASVDLSNTYLDWAHENLLLNGFGGPEHELHRADCLEWLESRAACGAALRSDLPRSADLLELQAHGRACSTCSAITWA